MVLRCVDGGLRDRIMIELRKSISVSARNFSNPAETETMALETEERAQLLLDGIEHMARISQRRLGRQRASPRKCLPRAEVELCRSWTVHPPRLLRVEIPAVGSAGNHYKAAKGKQRKDPSHMSASNSGSGGLCVKSVNLAFERYAGAVAIAPDKETLATCAKLVERQFKVQW
jgi:hypothetical protein